MRMLIGAGVMMNCLLLVAASASAQSPLLREIEASFVRLHEEVGPSVVNIETRGPAEEPSGDISEYFRFFGIPTPDGQRPQPDGQRPQVETPPNLRIPAPEIVRPRATGSGFVYSEDGFIVTNNHVVDGAETIIVRMHNLEEYKATVVGTDPETDIAVIKIDPKDQLIAARLGDSDSLKVGMFAIAIGSPRGFEGSVSFGHISALGREDLQGLTTQGLQFQNLIQTDAAINLGNSGGPLCNINGDVIGMNTAILWGANSIGFAIPINTAKLVVPALITDGKVIRGYLGVRIKNAWEVAEALEMPDRQGAFIPEPVDEGTPAHEADIRLYDVIRSVNGATVRDANDLMRRISALPPGTTVKLEIWRDNKLIEKEAKLGERPSPLASLQPEREPQVHGMTLQNLSPELAEGMGLDKETAGVLIARVRPGSPAEEAGLVRGDIITEVAQQPVGSVDELREVFEERGKPGRSLLVRHIREGRKYIVVLHVPEE